MRRGRLGLLVVFALTSVVCVSIAACSAVDDDDPDIEGAGDFLPMSQVVADSILELGCEPTLQLDPPRLSIAVPIESFAGDYALVVVVTAGFENDTIAHGSLWLRPTDSSHGRAPNPDVTFPLAGASDIDLGSIGPVSLLYSAASVSQDKPGVQVAYDSETQELWLMFGSASGRDYVTIHSGVLFNVFSIDSLGFSGRWVDGGIFQPVPEGYFCARRLPMVK